jgi:hypothetical protein
VGHLNILVYTIQRVPQDCLVALGACLDIEGAFNDTIFECRCTAHEYAVEHNVVRWIHAMLKNQQILIVQMGCMMRVSTERSPVLIIELGGGWVSCMTQQRRSVDARLHVT